jgi:hypothetical protein
VILLGEVKREAPVRTEPHPTCALPCLTQSLARAVCFRLPLALPSVKAAVFIAVAEIDSHPYSQPSEEPNPGGQR